MNIIDNIEQSFETEVKQRWGDTDAYKESQHRTGKYSKEKWNAVLEGLDSVFAEFAECRNNGDRADSKTAQELVKKLQNYISANFYTCTDDILSGLGGMYACDGRFKSNIDKKGSGTADFVSKAIKIYCNK